MITSITEVSITEALVYGLGNVGYRLLKKQSEILDTDEITDILEQRGSPYYDLPTKQQIIDWENDRLTEIEEEETVNTSIQTSLASNPINNSNVDIAFQLLNDLTVAYLDGLNPTTATVYSNFVTRLGGTNLETPIINYVTMITGHTNFGLAITDLQKREIMMATLIFIQGGLIVWLGKKI